MNKNIPAPLAILIIIIIAGISGYLIIEQTNYVLETGFPSPTLFQPHVSPTIGTLTVEKAQSIALGSSCTKEGTIIAAQYTYNPSTKTWWFDFIPAKKQNGCNPACVVDEKTQTAEINWRCTGLLTP